MAKNHEADITNNNGGTSGTNETWEKAMENRRKQLAQNQKLAKKAKK